MFLDDRSNNARNFANLSLDQIIDSVKEENLLSLYLQPIINNNNHNIYGYEVLSRWSYSDMLIDDRSYNLRDQIALTMLFENIESFPDGKLFINCCLSNLDFLADLIEKSNTGRDLIIELDFSLELFETKSLISRIERLHKIQGISIAIDDIGKYNLDLKLYHYLKPAYLKVDICIARGIFDDSLKQEKLEKIVDLAQFLNAKLIIEGVETENDAEYLKENNHPLIQGFYYNKPRPYSEFLK